MSSNIKLLPTEFIGRGEVSGVPFRQVYKSGEWYIYERDFEPNSTKSTFEVFRRKTAKDYDFKSRKHFETLAEIYPKANSFGVWAWSAGTLERAMQIIEDKTKKGTE